MINGVDAMAAITDRPREIVIQSQPCETREVLVAVRDSGIGLDAESADRLFSAFFTTKPQRDGNGAVDQPLDYHGPRRQTVGLAKCGSRFSFSIYRTD